VALPLIAGDCSAISGLRFDMLYGPAATVSVQAAHITNAHPFDQ